MYVCNLVSTIKPAVPQLTNSNIQIFNFQKNSWEHLDKEPLIEPYFVDYSPYKVALKIFLKFANYPDLKCLFEFAKSQDFWAKTEEMRKTNCLMENNNFEEGDFTDKQMYVKKDGHLKIRNREKRKKERTIEEVKSKVDE